MGRNSAKDIWLSAYGFLAPLPECRHSQGEVHTSITFLFHVIAVSHAVVGFRRVIAAQHNRLVTPRLSRSNGRRSVEG